MARGITVIDVIRSMGIEPTPDLSWSVGNAVRTMWERETGELPPKHLRTKTAGTGSHCFAIYPPAWRDKIAVVIRAHRVEAARQSDLFGEK